MRWSVFVLMCIAFLAQAQAPKKPEHTTAEVRLTDNTRIMLTLLDDSVPITTPHGKLVIPLADIRKIEFGYRLPDDVLKQIDTAIAALASNDTRDKEAAGARLLKIGPRAYPAVVKAAKSANRDLVIAARQLLEKFQEAFPEDRLPRHDMDVVHTDDAKIAGRIEITGVRVLTPQFGERVLKLTDILSVRATNAEPELEVAVNVQADPGSMSNFQGQVGKSYWFKVTGNAGGTIYGSDLYTLDSQISTAAVHAGVLKNGETGIIKVTLVDGQNQYQATSRNGVTSNGWGQYHGSYKVSKQRQQ